MYTTETSRALSRLFSELVDGTSGGDAFILNTGDVGLLRSPRESSDIELTGMISSVAHLAYHLGAIRQIDAAIQGPKAD